MFDYLKTPLSIRVMDRVRMAYGNRPDGDPLENIPGSNLLLPRFGRLSEAPQSMTSAGVHRIMNETVESVGQACETWALACGLFCGLATEELVSMDLVGEALRGTPAEVPWLVGQYDEAVSMALQSLGMSCKRSIELYRDGFEEAGIVANAIAKAKP